MYNDSTSVPTSIFSIPANRDNSDNKADVSTSRHKSSTIDSKPIVSFNQETDSG